MQLSLQVNAGESRDLPIGPGVWLMTVRIKAIAIAPVGEYVNVIGQLYGLDVEEVYVSAVAEDGATVEETGFFSVKLRTVVGPCARASCPSAPGGGAASFDICAEKVG